MKQESYKVGAKLKVKYPYLGARKRSTSNPRAW